MKAAQEKRNAIKKYPFIEMKGLQNSKTDYPLRFLFEQVVNNKNAINCL
jgi:hypothetical protein